MQTSDRRRFLTNASVVVGAVGAGFVAVPFLSFWSPSERAKAAGAPIEVDISQLEEGQLLIVEWRGKPVWIVRRNQEMMASLAEIESELSDPESKKSEQPDYAVNTARSLNDSTVLIMLGVCTHLGCSPKFRPERGDASIDPDWKGGFFCPCHGSTFDMAGRVFKNVPAPTNLPVPPYKYLNDDKTLVLVGDDSQETA